MPDDEKFVERLRQGDKEACAICAREHSANVYHLALKLTGDPVAAEDVLRETFPSAFRAVPRFEGKAQLSTWLYRMAHNAALMRLRKRKCRRSHWMRGLHQPQFFGPLERGAALMNI